MVVVDALPTSTGCGGDSGRIGIGIGSPWLSSLGPPLMTSPGRLGLPVIAVVPSLDGTRVVGAIRSLMFPSLVPSSRNVSPGFRPGCSAEVVLAPSLSRGSLVGSALEP